VFLKDVKLSLEHTGREKRRMCGSLSTPRGSWSYIGTTVCRFILAADNESWLGNVGCTQGRFPQRGDPRIRPRSGLLHEHNHPEAASSGTRPPYMPSSQAAELLDKATIDSNVFAKFDASTVITTDFDNVSVMIYTVPSDGPSTARALCHRASYHKGRRDHQEVVRLSRTRRHDADGQE